MWRHAASHPGFHEDLATERKLFAKPLPAVLHEFPWIGHQLPRHLQLEVHYAPACFLEGGLPFGLQFGPQDLENIFSEQPAERAQLIKRFPRGEGSGQHRGMFWKRAYGRPVRELRAPILNMPIRFYCDSIPHILFRSWSEAGERRNPGQGRVSPLRSSNSIWHQTVASLRSTTAIHVAPLGGIKGTIWRISGAGMEPKSSSLTSAV